MCLPFSVPIVICEEEVKLDWKDHAVSVSRSYCVHILLTRKNAEMMLTKCYLWNGN